MKRKETKDLTISSQSQPRRKKKKERKKKISETPFFPKKNILSVWCFCLVAYYVSDPMNSIKIAQNDHEW